MKAVDAIKFFGLNNLGIESEIKKIEESLGVDLGHRPKNKPEIDRDYYPQFSQRLRDESEAMASQYCIFFCLENSIRELIRQRLSEVHGGDWWDKPNIVPQNIAKECSDNRKREMGMGITPRSNDMLDYSTFGQLGEIIRHNWDVFGGTFRDREAVGRIMHALNTLRGPIAHCIMLAEDEVLRLHLLLKDWFRQMS